jgi:hypothetical protein
MTFQNENFVHAFGKVVPTPPAIDLTPRNPLYHVDWDITEQINNFEVIFQPRKNNDFNGYTRQYVPPHDIGHQRVTFMIDNSEKKDCSACLSGKLYESLESGKQFHALTRPTIEKTLFA